MRITTLTLVAVLFLAGQPAYAVDRACELEYNCASAAMLCRQVVKGFATWPEFQTWLDANPNINWWVINSTTTTIKIVYETNCAVGKVCRDKYGVCNG